MDGIYTAAGGRFKTKKSLREAIGSQVSIEPTSAFGNAPTRYPYDAAVVGPHPYKRVWYARVEIDASGILRRVDGKGAPKKKNDGGALARAVKSLQSLGNLEIHVVDGSDRAPIPATSYRVEVFVEGSWSGNALRFPDVETARAYGRDLLSRWMLPTEYRVVGSADPVTETSPAAGQ